MPLSPRSQQVKTSSNPISKHNITKPRRWKNIFATTERVRVKEEPKENKLSSLLYPELPISPPLESRNVEVEEGNSGEESRLLVASDASSPPPCRDGEALISANTQAETVIDTQQDKEDYINLFCTRCKRKFSRKDTYRQHLQKIHKKVLNPSTTINHPIKPDKDDPNFHCAACKKNFNHKRSYRYHLEIIHGISCTRPPAAKPKKYYLPGQPGYKSDAYCSKCERGFGSRQGYLSHLRRTHQLIPILTPETTPDEEDPNLYCSACEKIFTRKSSYRFHLRTFHEMKLRNNRQVIRHPECLPDVNDPNLYCNACKRVYSSRDSFNNHMRRIHRLERQQQSKKRQPPLYLLSTILLESAGLKITN